MIHPDRLKDLSQYFLPSSITPLRPDQVQTDSWDQPLREQYQLFRQDHGSQRNSLIKWRSGAENGEIHSGTAIATAVRIPPAYMESFYVALHSWARTVPPDRQQAYIADPDLGGAEASGHVLYITQDLSNAESRVAMALVTNYALLNTGEVWILDTEHDTDADKVVFNAIQEASDRMNTIGQTALLV